MLGFLLAFLPTFPQKTIDLITWPGTTSSTCSWRALDARLVPQVGERGTKIFEIKGSPYGMNGSITLVRFPKAPTGRKLDFTISFRGSKPGNAFSVESISTTKPARGKFNWLQQWNDEGKLDAKSWHTVRRTFVADSEAVGLTLIIHNPSLDPIYFKDAHLTVGGPAKPDLDAVAAAMRTRSDFEEEKIHPSDTYVEKNHDRLAKQVGPVMIRVVMRAPLRTNKVGEEGTIRIPLPNRDESQIPIGFKLSCDKPGKLLGFKWSRGDNGNLVCDARLVPGAKGSWLTWESLVLVHNGPDPADRGMDTYLASTACVQSAAPRIKEIATNLAKSAPTDELYAKSVYAYVRNNRGLGKPFKQLDALAALDCEGSCTNRANLSAALLRAHGLPARTVAHMPTWCDKLYEHWLTEYWTGTEWVALDPSLGRWKPDRRTRVEFGYASTADENRAFDKQHLRFVMPGAPYQSVCELSPTLYAADLTDSDAINWAEQVCLLPAASETATVARAAVAFEKLFKACSKGQMDVAAFNRSLSAAKKKNTDGLFH